jgi:hypothetical protein
MARYSPRCSHRCEFDLPGPFKTHGRRPSIGVPDPLAGLATRQLWPAPADRDSSLCCKRHLKAVVCQFRNRYREFESTPLHHSVLHFSYLSENCSQSARVRAICDDGWTRRASPAAPIGRIGRILSGRDFGRSIGKAAGIGRFAPPGWHAAVLTIFSQGCGKSLPSWRRQSNECSRRQGYQALAREGDLT